MGGDAIENLFGYRLKEAENGCHDPENRDGGMRGEVGLWSKVNKPLAYDSTFDQIWVSGIAKTWVNCCQGRQRSIPFSRGMEVCAALGHMLVAIRSPPSHLVFCRFTTGCGHGILCCRPPFCRDMVKNGISRPIPAGR
jgi:hypothetical protein